MQRIWLFALTLFVTAFLAQPASFLGQEDSKKQGEEAVPLYHVGQGITAPHAIYAPDPEYDDASRKAKRSGVVLISLIVTKEGEARDVKVSKSLSRGLDKKAIEAVSQLRFSPATKDGEPIAVQINVEVSFRIR